jgi:hypothetical protein
MSAHMSAHQATCFWACLWQPESEPGLRTGQATERALSRQSDATRRSGRANPYRARAAQATGVREPRVKTVRTRSCEWRRGHQPSRESRSSRGSRDATEPALRTSPRSDMGRLRLRRVCQRRLRTRRRPMVGVELGPESSRLSPDQTQRQARSGESPRGHARTFFTGDNTPAACTPSWSGSPMRLSAMKEFDPRWIKARVDSGSCSATGS